MSNYEKAKADAISQKKILIRQKTSSDSNNLVIVVGEYIGKFDKVDRCPDCDCGVSEYDKKTDEYYLEEGFYEQQVNWDEYKFLKIPDNLIIDWTPLNYGYQKENNNLLQFVEKVATCGMDNYYHEIAEEAFNLLP